MIPATQLRAGMVIKHNGDPYRIMNVLHVTPGNWRGMVQTKMRNLLTGNQTEYRFRSEDKVDRVTIEQHEMEYLYHDGEGFHFMNTESFEQTRLNEDDLGDAAHYLLPNLKIAVELYEGRPIGVSLPKTLELAVTDTAPALKNATVTNVQKPATCETGVVIQVPGFVAVGDVITVDTETGEYLSRRKGG